MAVRLAILLALSAVARSTPQQSSAPTASALGTRFSLCSPCVQLGSEGINTLLQYLLHAGVASTCEELCSAFPQRTEQTICSLACEILGIRAFVEALNHTDLDPIYFCEVVGACPPGPQDASASIVNVSAMPTSVAKGSTVRLDCDVDVMNATGVGEFRVTVRGPVTTPYSRSFLLPTGIPVGRYSLGTQLVLEDDQSADPPVVWQPGQYSFEFEVCQGECGSKHPHSKIFGKAAGTFNITKPSPWLDAETEARLVV